ncbi:MAG: F0F1 ATP synthase subunit A [Acidimicrobiales bacterium]
MGTGLMGGLLMLPAHRLAVNITVGDHYVTKLGPFTLNLDTIWYTGVALAVVVAVCVLVRRQATSGVPGRLQLAFETGVQAVTRQVEGSIGPRGRSIIPLAMALFLFLFVANSFELFELGSKYEWLSMPTADINLPLALAVFVIALVHIASIRARGVRGYFRHYLFQPFPKWMMPYNLFINVVEEGAKPITLALRLFGNMFSGLLMVTLIAALAAWNLGPVPIGDVFTFLFDVIWKIFDSFIIGAIQAFIFALLTILYFDTAMTAEHGPTKQRTLTAEP